MKRLNRIAFSVVCCVFASQAVWAQATIDTVKVHQLNEVVVKGVRAAKEAPYAVANIKKSELQQFSRTGKELPFLLSRTPGILAWGENGLGTGTSYMRIRGAAGSRINVTLDGVALNSPEDQTVFWANMNSYAALLGSVQIQRGIGSSTNGDGAFGGSISMATAFPSLIPTAEVTGSFGSFNTYNTGVSFSTGLLGKHLIFDGAYHETATDGYIDGTSGRSGSYYGGLTWLADNFKVSYKNIGNFEKTGQAWNGVLASDYDTNFTLMSDGIYTYKDMDAAGLGKFNILTAGLVRNGKGDYTIVPYTMRDGSLWNKTTDNFYQNHNILSAVWTPNDHWSHNFAVHYTYGYGYYNEFKSQSKFAKFGLTFYDADGNFVKRSDFVRKKGLTQHTYGIVYNTNYKDEHWDVIGGLNLQQFRGNHWGYLTYIANQAAENQFLGSNGQYKYYDSDAHKYDYSAFVKANYRFADNWNVFADLQFRRVEYKTDGVNDKFVEQADGTYKNQVLDINEKFNFFNPKAGISYTNNGHKAYASVAYSNREPERNNYTDNYNYPFPEQEKLLDVEFGYQYQGSNWHAGANFYYMGYDNQLVQTGQLSDIGEALTTNVKDSYRMGVELTAGWAPLSWMSLEGNASLSKNKIKDFDEYVDNWDGDPLKIHYDNSTLSFSPSAILNGFIDLHYAGFSATWHTNFVSSQYLDNSESKDRSLPCYSQSDLSINYGSKVTKACGIKHVTIGFDINNIFGRCYAPSGFVWYNAVSESAGYTKDHRLSAISYIPMAGTTFMTHLTLKF
ncbi:TonB-dependent receptor [Prevotella brevis]|uniref:TonB-dependent receptor n=1 Tax=Xylanibacter brevis TaxID=83231 RepID=A0ABS9CHP6_9BACT|nr:TonB-dependent receptor [Xylanibacter brevis]MCF2564269.1 TonB-dependent receptor [Xylanibacter brevis]